MPQVPAVSAFRDRHGLRRRALRAAAVLALATLAVGAAAARTLHLAATDYPPYYSARLPSGGPVAQLTLAALRKAGYQVELQFLPWAQALREGELGQVDGLVGVWHSPEREAAFLYSLPVVNNRIVLCGLPGRMPARFTSFEALRSQVIGIVRGYANPPALADALVRTEEVDDDLQNLLKLQAGRVDLVLIDARVERYLQRRSLPRGSAAIGCLEPTVQEQPQYLVVSRQAVDAAPIVAAFNTQLNRMIDSGEYAQIAEQAGL